MRIDDRILKTVVFIGHVGPSGDFIPHGTGFIAVSYIGDDSFQQIVTARHVIDGIAGDLISVRLNTNTDGARVIGITRDWWKFHPDPKIDVAISPSKIPKDQFDIIHLDIAGMLTAEDDQPFGPGDEVLIPGLYIGRIGEAKNIPIVRGGSIAAMPEEPIDTSFGIFDAYLVESLSIDGLSGSPVFGANSVISYVDGKIAPNDRIFLRLIGMMIGRNEVVNAPDAVEIKQKHFKRDPETVIASVAMNTGIGIVIPLRYVSEAINQPTVHEGRVSAMAEKRSKSTFKHSSASYPATASKADRTEA